MNPKAPKPKRGIPSGKSPLDNQRHEKFAQLVAKGKPDMQAYQTAYECSIEVANSNACRLRGNDGVRRRIKHLQQLVERKTVLSMVERREFLARVVRSNLATFDPSVDGDLIQEITEEDTPTGKKKKLKLPGKRECIMADAQLAGDLVEKVQMDGQVLHVVLTEGRRAELMEKRRAALARANVIEITDASQSQYQSNE